MSKKVKNIAKIESNYVKNYDAYLERQKKKNKRLHRRLVLFTIVAMITFGTIIAYNLNQRTLYSNKQEELEELEERMTSLKEEEKGLKQEIELLNDEEYVLQIARTNYFFSKEGELIFKLPEQDSSY
ncbi:septum formation initiator family protein [Aquibacillus halophilus]|uniref:Septum formation initiator family protein n=1 Tax=Aquibacillus halophilus TaxID=930132 RepID=A0A6A8DUV8_9BACI|nr:septum formation initiator family protein [Aquibacillus halophilus]